MKSKIKIVSIVLFLSVSILLVSFSEQKTEWKGKIEYENGVKVIKNPREPLYGGITFELEEDLSIGNEEDENYMFYRYVRIAVDSDDNIFVVDGVNYRIQKFDRNGDYLQTIGSEGQGPGEFERLNKIHLDSDDNIYVQDGRKMHIFNKKGKLMNTIKISRSMGEFGITKEGSILATNIHQERSSDIPSNFEIILNVELIDSNGEKIKTIASFHQKESPQIKKGIDQIYFNTRHEPNLFLCSLNEELAIYGYSSEYKLFAIDSSGDIAYIIKKEEPPQLITKKDKDEVIDRFMEKQERQDMVPKLSRSEVIKGFKFPKYQPFFTRILKDDRDRIYVTRFRLSYEREKSVSFDLFNKEGYYLYEVIVPSFFPFMIKKGHVYKSEYDQKTGYYKVKRYKIKNWNQIKERI